MEKDRRKIWAFAYAGGKLRHLNRIIPLLPRENHFCDVFGGSASVIVNVIPYPIETYNDLDLNIVTFFRVLRNQSNKLVDALRLTPYSRKEYADAVTLLSMPHDETDSFSRAKAFYICVRQSRGGKYKSGDWTFSRNLSRRGISKLVSGWKGTLDMLPLVAERLLMVQIECRPALDVIRLYDTYQTLFYCDPPYPPESRTPNLYNHEMTTDDHRELAKALTNVKGKVALSGYKCDLMDELYGDWHTTFWLTRSSLQKGHGSRMEGLWTNYEPTDEAV
jgi:DNA adenine methylase